LSPTHIDKSEVQLTAIPPVEKWS